VAVGFDAGREALPQRSQQVLHDKKLWIEEFHCYDYANTWARTIGQCGNNVSFGPLVLLPTGKVLLAET